MIKEFFGWLIAICRRWAVGSSYKNKTSRARWGLSLICSAYVLGIMLNLVFLFEPKVPKSLPKEVFSVLLIAIFIVPLLILNKTYPPEVADVYITKYTPQNLAQNVKQQLLALAFCIGGWLVLFGPFMILK
ncbi:hypothetical protein OPS25_07195 [Alteromonas ponticola]|uniref:Uncharacterized protein n=1 Tax=Alteromonas aquimaris TaxID=2998417 RepID=A0ABT3P695_9ALTE|nr:hypothetical protein [Alteromonas aquimaris]MCW8108277.1 hypothetical protein [Alteromonas aquimaris]